jgi:hypothetical protein
MKRAVPIPLSKKNTNSVVLERPGYPQTSACAKSSMPPIPLLFNSFATPHTWDKRGPIALALVAQPQLAVVIAPKRVCIAVLVHQDAVRGDRALHTYTMGDARSFIKVFSIDQFRYMMGFL